jgi:molecular chaperone DnaK (HSP70)
MGVPTLISFNDKNDKITKRENAEELKISNPVYTIFNFMKFIGKNSDEIDGKKELWPYKLYHNIKTGRPYVKINNNIYKNKVYNFEDLLSLYLRKLFQLLFSKFKIKNDKKNNLLKINIIVTVPNDFNYSQRKVIEKIFLTQLFPRKLAKDTLSNYYSEDNKKNCKNNSTQLYTYGIYNIQIKNIKIENSSNIGYLYLFQKQIENNFNNYNKKIILVHIDGGSVNVSLISTIINNNNNNYNESSEKDNNNNENYVNKYEIKGIKGTSFGEEDFTDAFINSCLGDFTEKIRNVCIKTPSALAKLRKSCETAKKYFYKTEQTEIKIQKLYDSLDF